MPYELWCIHFKAHRVKFRKTAAMHHSQSWWHGRFNCAWYAYVDLLDIDYSDGFNCSICKHQVDVVICDGTPLSFRRKFLITAPKEETKKHVKCCKVAPMQKDVYWPQHAGDFCRGTQEGTRARKGSCCPMNLIQCYLSWTQSVRHPSYKKKMMENSFVVIQTSRTFFFYFTGFRFTTLLSTATFRYNVHSHVRYHERWYNCWPSRFATPGITNSFLNVGD